MKRFILFTLGLIVAIVTFSQTITGDRIIARHGLYLKDTWLDSIQKSGDFETNRTVPSSKAVSDYIRKGVRTLNVLVDTLNEPDFEIIVLPDLQYQTLNWADSSLVGSTFNWIVNNKTTANIKAVLQVGDLTDDGISNQFTRVDSNYDKLDNAGIPYLYVPGNHDYDGGSPTDSRLTTSYDSWMGPSRYASHSYYGGNYSGSNANYYIKIDVGRKKILIVGLEFQPRDAIITWAQSILDANTDRETIVVTHALITGYGEKSQDTSGANNYGLTNANNGTELWDKLISKNKQIIMTLSGHYGRCCGGGWQTLLNTNLGPFVEERLTQTGDNGNIVHMLGYNHQSDSLAGAGHMMRLKFKPNAGKIDVSFFNARYEATDQRSFNYSLYYPPVKVDGPLAVKDRFNVAGEATFDSSLKITALPKWRPVITGYNGKLDSIAAADSSYVLISQGPNKPPKYDTLPGNSNAYIKNLPPKHDSTTGFQTGNFWIKGTGVVGGATGMFRRPGNTPGTFYVSHQSGNFGLIVQRAAGVNTSGANMVFFHSYASDFGATPVPVGNGAELGTIRWMGVDSSLVGKVGASLRSYVEAKGSNYIGGGFDFRTTINASDQDVTRMFLHYDGSLDIKNLGSTGNILVGADNVGKLRKVFLSGLAFNSGGDTLSVTPQIVSNTSTLDFPSTLAGSSSELTISVTGANVGDAVGIGLPSTVDANSSYIGYVSAAGVVTLRFNNYSSGSIDPGSGQYRAVVFKY